MSQQDIQTYVEKCQIYVVFPNFDLKNSRTKIMNKLTFIG